MRSRRGFTLLELWIVLAILAVSAALVAPALTRLGQQPAPGAADGLLTLLRETRRVALQRNVTVTLRLDPTSGRYRADTTGVAGSGEFGEGTLALGAQDALTAATPRLTYVFQSTGAAFADTVLVRANGTSALVSVDPWSGVAYATPR